MKEGICFCCAYTRALEFINMRILNQIIGAKINVRSSVYCHCGHLVILIESPKQKIINAK